MVDMATVNLYGQPVGTFRWDNSRQLAHFEYAESFIGKGLEPSPILMPVRSGRIYSFSDIGRETFKGLPGRSSGNAVETLCFFGKRYMGELGFEPAMDAPYSPDVRIELDSLVEVATRLKDDTSGMLDIIMRRAVKFFDRWLTDLERETLKDYDNERLGFNN